MNSLWNFPGRNFCRQVRQVFWKPRTFCWYVFHCFSFISVLELPGDSQHCWRPVLILIPRTKRFATMTSCCLICAFERASQRRGWGCNHGRCRKRDVYFLSTHIWLLFTDYIPGTKLILYFGLKYWDYINIMKSFTHQTGGMKVLFTPSNLFSTRNRVLMWGVNCGYPLLKILLSDGSLHGVQDFCQWECNRFVPKPEVESVRSGWDLLCFFDILCFLAPHKGVWRNWQSGIVWFIDQFCIRYHTLSWLIEHDFLHPPRFWSLFLVDVRQPQDICVDGVANDGTNRGSKVLMNKFTTLCDGDARVAKSPAMICSSDWKVVKEGCPLAEWIEWGHLVAGVFFREKKKHVDCRSLFEHVRMKRKKHTSIVQQSCHPAQVFALIHPVRSFAGLGNLQGRCVVNAICLMVGEDEFLQLAKELLLARCGKWQVASGDGS